MDTITVTIKLLGELFTWRSVLDILLIAALIFFLYRTFLRLGTGNIVLGIFLAIAVFIMASLLDLTGVKWIYSNVSHVAVIAIIVIFQPELRKMLERAVSLRRTEVGEARVDVSDVVGEALFKLAEQNRGAIVVFPGKEPIREWFQGGFRLNAEPSYPLIMSIFDPNSPGHDGAVIIINGKLTHFGVRLPGSQTNRLSAEYGTRHNAALGLSEVSDALVLVVSEERGEVSIFHQGKIKKAHDRIDVSSSIEMHWKQIASYPFKLSKTRRRWILGPQVILSTALAVIFLSTLYLAKGQIVEKVLNVPVEFIGTPKNMVLVGEKVSEVKLHLTGPKPDLDSLTPYQLSVKIDLSKSMPGKQTFVITEEEIKLPRNVQLLDAVPSNLTLTLSSIMEHDIPVKAQMVGKLPKGLELRSVKIRPEKVRVLSPLTEGAHKGVSVTTTPIYLENLKETTSLSCKIIAPPNIQPAERRWPDVEVSIEITPK